MKLDPRQIPPDLSERFEILRHLARGGFGDVLLARQRSLNRLAAVKVLRADRQSEDEFLKRFLREARITASLRHPHIVKVVDFGADHQHPWIAYEFIEGPTLRTLMTAGILDRVQVAEMGIQVASALQYAHDHGVLHRDIKPENVMQAGPGSYKLTDLGLAKAEDHQTVLTADDTLMGTPGYIAPEIAIGDPAHPGSDLYALGIMLYELIVGRRPFEGPDPMQVLRAHVEQEPAPPSSRVPDLPREVDRVLLRALEKDPARRYGHGGSMARDLEVLLGILRQHPGSGARPRAAPDDDATTDPTFATGPDPAPPGGTGRGGGPPGRRSRPIAGIALAVAGAASVVAGAWLAGPGPGGKPAAAPPPPVEVTDVSFPVTGRCVLRTRGTLPPGGRAVLDRPGIQDSGRGVEPGSPLVIDGLLPGHDYRLRILEARAGPEEDRTRLERTFRTPSLLRIHHLKVHASDQVITVTGRSWSEDPLTVEVWSDAAPPRRLAKREFDRTRGFFASFPGLDAGASFRVVVRSTRLWGGVAGYPAKTRRPLDDSEVALCLSELLGVIDERAFRRELDGPDIMLMGFCGVLIENHDQRPLPALLSAMRSARPGEVPVETLLSFRHFLGNPVYGKALLPHLKIWRKEHGIRQVGRMLELLSFNEDPEAAGIAWSHWDDPVGDRRTQIAPILATQGGATGYDRLARVVETEGWAGLWAMRYLVHGDLDRARRLATALVERPEAGPGTVAGLEALALIAGEEDRAVLRRSLGSGRPLRALAAQALARLGDPGSLPALEEAWRRNPDDPDLMWACVLLGGSGLEPELLARLDHPDPGQRRLAALALAETGSRGATGPLLSRLGDDAPAMREAAWISLARLGGVDPGPIRHRLDVESPIPPSLVWALGTLRDRAAGPRIRAILLDPPAGEPVGGDAGGLARGDWGDLVPPTPRSRPGSPVASTGPGRTPSPGGTPSTGGASPHRSGDPDGRAALQGVAAWAVGRLGDTRVVGRLRDLAGASESEFVRDCARSALDELAGSRPGHEFFLFPGQPFVRTGVRVPAGVCVVGRVSWAWPGQGSGASVPSYPPREPVSPTVYPEDLAVAFLPGMSPAHPGGVPVWTAFDAEVILTPYSRFPWAVPILPRTATEGPGAVRFGFDVLPDFLQPDPGPGLRVDPGGREDPEPEPTPARSSGPAAP